MPAPASISGAAATGCASGPALNPPPLTSPLTLAVIVAIVGVFLTLVSVMLAYLVDRGRRYNYLADRWNALMHMDIDEPDFFEAHSTGNYKSFDRSKLIKYHQHARMHWGAVEDIVRNDYPFERLVTA